MSRFMSLLLTTVMAVLGWLAPPAFAVLVSPSTQDATYVYDAPIYDAPGSDAASQRGPPAEDRNHATYDAVDRGSHDASARLDGATPPAPFAYDHAGSRAQGANSAPGATLTGVRADAGRLSALERSQVATNTERTVAMGRNMADRVIPYAEKNGFDWYKGTPGWVPRTAIEKVSAKALEKTDLWFNKRWINNEMRGGSRIVDIGEPPGYPPSAFYNMERQQVSGYWNYVQDTQP